MLPGISQISGGRGTRTPMGGNPAVFKTAALPIRSSPPGGGQSVPETASISDFGEKSKGGDWEMFFNFLNLRTKYRLK